MIEPREYPQVEFKLKSLLHLEKPPVAVKLFESAGDAAKILAQTNKKAMHCQFVCEAFNSSFYTTLDKHTCIKGAGVLGLIDTPMEVEQIDKKIEAIGYAPLRKALFVPDSVLLYLKPVDAFNFTKMYHDVTGKRIEANMAGINAVCSESVVIPKKTNQPNVSFGCTGSRLASNLVDDELIISLTTDNIEELLEIF